jgi:hypothetical protein
MVKAASDSYRSRNKLRSVLDLGKLIDLAQNACRETETAFVLWIAAKGGRLARRRGGKGKMRTAPITRGQSGVDRIRDESATYVARYRDGNGLVVEVSTGCRDKTAAQSVLADLERLAEKVRSGLLTTAEARSTEHLSKPLRDHIGACIESMKAWGVTSTHRKAAYAYLNRLSQECAFGRLADLSRDALERWLAQEADKGRSARSRNAHLASAVSFGRW